MGWGIGGVQNCIWWTIIASKKKKKKKPKRTKSSFRNHQKLRGETIAFPGIPRTTLEVTQGRSRTFQKLHGKIIDFLPVPIPIF